MASKGYCTKAQVAAALGRTFTAAQDTECDLLIESAEQWIDRYKHQAWAVATITGETHLAEGGYITLTSRPVTAISALSVTAYPAIGATADALVSETSYDLLDATEGRVYLGDWYDGFLVTVSYTAPSTVPANVRDACKLLVAHWMRPALDGLSDDVASYTVPGEISVTFRDGEGHGSVPATVLDLLGRRLVLA